MLRVPSSLDAETERLVTRTIGCCLRVHKELGPGFSERVYAEACAAELEDEAIPFEREKAIAIRYRGRLLCHHRLDFLIDGAVVLEAKSIERFHPVHVAQVVGYLRLADVRAGLLVNFNVELLKQGIRRVVL